MAELKTPNVFREAELPQVHTNSLAHTIKLLMKNCETLVFHAATILQRYQQDLTLKLIIIPHGRNGSE